MVLFSEDHILETRRRGRIEVICGSMFSGKTEELIRRMKRAQFAKQRVEIFKPAIDTRYSKEEVVSHDSHSIASTPIDSSASILLFTSEIDVVGIDEAQFFDNGLVDVCNQLANNGIRVIIAGLDMDFKNGKYAWMVKIGEKGQFVIPKEARELFDLQPGNEILVLGDEKRGIAILPKEMQMEYIQKIFSEIDE